MRPETAARKENVDTTERRMQCTSTKIRNSINVGPRLQTNVIKLSDRPQKSPLNKGGYRLEVISQLPTADCRLPTAEGTIRYVAKKMQRNS